MSEATASGSYNIGYQLSYIGCYDGSGSLVVQNGKEEQIVPLTASQFSDNFPRYARLNFVDQVKSRIIASPDATTNMNKLNDPVNAAFTGQSLPLLRGTKYESLVIQN